jgi:hypothetical protein
MRLCSMTLVIVEKIKAISGRPATRTTPTHGGTAPWSVLVSSLNLVSARVTATAYAVKRPTQGRQTNRHINPVARRFCRRIPGCGNDGCGTQGGIITRICLLRPFHQLETKRSRTVFMPISRPQVSAAGLRHTISRAGVSCTKIDEAIRVHDNLLLILSEASLNSNQLVSEGVRAPSEGSAGTRPGGWRVRE